MRIDERHKKGTRRKNDVGNVGVRERGEERQGEIDK